MVTRISWERLAALAGLAFVVLYVVAFSLGIEVGDSDREILAYYASSGHRAKEIVAFFLIAGAALALVVFATALRSLIARAEQETTMLAALAWAGGIACAVLVLAGSSRTPASCSLRAGRWRRSSSSSPSRSRHCATACFHAGSAGLAFRQRRC